MKPTRQCHIVLYRRRGETLWTIRHGWIPTDDAESLRQYFATFSSCEEFYVVASEPRNNAVQLFQEIRSDWENRNDEVATSKQLGARKAVTRQLLRRDKARIETEDCAEAERREQFREITAANGGVVLPVSDRQPGCRFSLMGRNWQQIRRFGWQISRIRRECSLMSGICPNS